MKTEVSYAQIDAMCATIEAREHDIGAFVPGTFSAARVRDDFDELLTQYPDPANRPPLFGQLLGVKDIFNVDGFPTRCGANLPAELFEGPEASCVTVLRKAGAIVAGKTVTTEFAVRHPGPTRNPHNLEHTPGGSSSGSAASVAAGFFPVAFGSQTAGSIIRPAAYCGVTGFKPSFGRIPIDGVIPYSTSMDHVGLIVSDIGLLDLVMRAIEPGWSSVSQATGSGSVVTAAIPVGPYLDQVSPVGLNHFEWVIETLRESGTDIVRIPVLNDIAELNEQLYRLTYREMFEVHREWLPAYRHLYRQSTLNGLETGADVSQAELARWLHAGTDLRQTLLETMRSEGVDVWISPSAPDVAPRGLQETGDPCMNSPWTYSGLPAVTIPTGENAEQLPYGLQLAGRFQEDEVLIAIAERFERILATSG